jgi:hypothetical protein
MCTYSKVQNPRMLKQIPKSTVLCRIWGSHSGGSRSVPSGIWRHVVRWVTTDVSEEHIAATCLLAFCWNYFDPEDGGSMFLRNVSCNSTDYMASYPRRWYSSTVLYQDPGKEHISRTDALLIFSILYSHPASLFRQMLVVIAVGNKCFGLVDTGYRGLEGNTTVDRGVLLSPLPWDFLPRAQ